MLLTAYTNGSDLLFPISELGETIFDCLINRVHPDLWFLFHVPWWQVWNQAVVLLSAGYSFAQFQVNYDRLGTLGSAVDTDVEHGEKREGTADYADYTDS
jgi:hypothetical protein